MPEFVFVDTNTAKESEGRRSVRSHAMRDFRRRQRLERSGQATHDESGHPPAVASAPNLANGHEALASNSPSAIRAPYTCDHTAPHIELYIRGNQSDTSAEADARAVDRLTRWQGVISHRQEPISLLPGALTSSYHRLGMQDAFCELFYPENRKGTHDLFHSVHPAPWAEQLTRNASDALCTLQIAISHTDRRLLQASLKLHDSALRRLQSVLGRHLYSCSSSSLMGAVYYLLKWESLMTTSWDSPAWQFHCAALLKLLAQRSAEDHGKDSKLPAYLSFTFCYATGVGLLSRKRVPHANMCQQQHSQLTSSALQVPPCLALLDAARNPRSKPGQVNTAVRRGLGVRQALLETIATYSTTSEGHMSFEIVNMSHYASLETTLGSDLSKLYPTAYLFSSFEVALALKTLWTSLLVLDRALLDVQQQYMFHFEGFGAGDFDDMEIEIEVNECADHICRALPYFSRSECKSSGVLCSMEPLHFLHLHFQTRNATRHLEWCRKLKEAIVPGYKLTHMLSK